MRVSNTDHQAVIGMCLPVGYFQKSKVAKPFIPECVGLIDDVEPVDRDRRFDLLQQAMMGDWNPGLGSGWGTGFFDCPPLYVAGSAMQYKVDHIYSLQGVI